MQSTDLTDLEVYTKSSPRGSRSRTIRKVSRPLKTI